jgi:hypothetical protein
MMGAAGILMASPLDLLAQAGTPGRCTKEICMEEQRGEPDLPPETLTYKPGEIETLSGTSKAQYLKRPSNFTQLFISEADAWINKNRQSNKEEISRVLDLFMLPFQQAGKYVPFCAAGLSFVAATVYAKQDKNNSAPYSLSTISNYLGEVDRYHFYPTPSVWDMFLVGQGKRRWIDGKSGKQVPKPGSLIVFDWGGNGGANHVGLVERYENGKIHTIEFNTVPDGATGSQRQGGHVAKKTRAYPAKTIKGFIDVEKNTQV